MEVIKRVFRFFRRETSDGDVAGGGTISSYGAPSWGWDRIGLFISLPAAADGGTLNVYQGTRTATGGATNWALTDSFAVAAGGEQSLEAVRSAELVKVEFVNGATAKTASILASLL